MTGRTSIQSEMKTIVQRWAGNLGSKRSKVLQGLTFDGVKQGLHHEGGSATTTGVSANHSHSHATFPSTSSGLGRQTAATSHQSYTTHDTGPIRTSVPDQKPHNIAHDGPKHGARPDSQHHGSVHHGNHHDTHPYTQAHDAHQAHQGQSTAYYDQSAADSMGVSTNYNANYPSSTYEGPQSGGTQADTRPYGRPTQSEDYRPDAFGSTSHGLNNAEHRSQFGRPQPMNDSFSMSQQQYQPQSPGFAQYSQYGQDFVQGNNSNFSPNVYGRPPQGPPQGPTNMTYGDSGDWTRAQAPFQQQFDQYGNPIQRNYGDRYG